MAGCHAIYKDFDSSDEESEEEYTDDDDGDYDEEEDAIYPPLTPLQLKLRQLCRIGDRVMLKAFLVDNPDLDLDAKDPEAETTALNEAATKTAQFSEIVQLLLEAGADLQVTDSLGNTPLHNAVLYYPSTQQTVDLLLEKGADVCAINYEGSYPDNLADDKDLIIVLRQLKKIAQRKKLKLGKKPLGYSGSPHMRKMVYDRKTLEERERKSIIVRYNSPVVVNSPGLLKRKRDGDEAEESFSCRRKRIRFCEQDSTGAIIEPLLSDEETESDIKNVDLDNNHDSEVALDSSTSECTVEDIDNTQKSIGEVVVTIMNVKEQTISTGPKSLSNPGTKMGATKQSSILRFFFPK